MKLRKATLDDLDLLAEWNHQLIADEGHRNPISIAELKERMEAWISSEYEAVVFSEEVDVAYALFRESESEIYLRQFFVIRPRRRQGVGKNAMRLLIDKVWPKGERLTVDVLSDNGRGIDFWRSVGYRDYCLTLEIQPETCANASSQATGLKRPVARGKHEKANQNRA